METSNKLYQKFFSDPDWHQVEKIIMDYLDPLIKMSDVDIAQPAEHVKAEIIGRQKLYTQMVEFLEQTGIVGRKPLQDNKNTFK
ncbi:MAG: hypothetical protein EBR82_14445 [Caulobacteraceae bacterium]|nr:hypothetical protein [Caulobacteraceae bacterium]